MIILIYLLGVFLIATFCSMTLIVSTQKHKTDCVGLGLVIGLMWPILAVQATIRFLSKFNRDSK
jgi:hypothetical protein